MSIDPRHWPSWIAAVADDPTADDLAVRTPEPEVMDDTDEVAAYSQANFAEVNARFVQRWLEVWSVSDLAREVAGFPRPVVLADLGCGPAEISLQVARAMAQRGIACRVMAIDASPAMLAAAAQHLAANSPAAGLAWPAEVCLVLAKADALPPDIPPLDGVVSNSLLHHLGEPIPLWREVARRVRPGGAILFRDLFRPPSRRAAVALTERHTAGETPLLQQLFAQSLVAAYRPDEITSQLAVAGLGHLRVDVVSDRHVDIWGAL